MTVAQRLSLALLCHLRLVLLSALRRLLQVLVHVDIVLVLHLIIIGNNDVARRVDGGVVIPEVDEQTQQSGVDHFLVLVRLQLLLVVQNLVCRLFLCGAVLDHLLYELGEIGLPLMQR